MLHPLARAGTHTHRCTHTAHLGSRHTKEGGATVPRVLNHCWTKEDIDYLLLTVINTLIKMDRGSVTACLQPYVCMCVCPFMF